MSRYTVKHYAELSRVQCYLGAEIAYNHPEYPWPSQQFSLYDYAKLVAEDAAGSDGLVCYFGPHLRGVLSFTGLIQDPHMPGKGVWVTQVVAQNPAVGAAMYRALIQLLRQHGASWFRIGKRLSATTILDEYRRVP